ncbi:MAG: CopD family protein [Proteobacteria bacterium]|nr:CopD family protein [Pseudomonadota bacterium]
MTTLFAIVRALHFASLMTAFGAAALLALAAPLDVDGARLRRALISCAIVATATAILWLGFVTQEIAGSALPGAMAAVATKSFYGEVFLVRLVLLLGLCTAMTRAKAYGLKALLAGLALAALGLTSHAAAAGDAAYALPRAINDALHLLTAGFWLGGLVVLATEVLATPRDGARVIGLLRLFSRYGTSAVGVLLLSGTLNAIAILDVAMAWSDSYVTLLAIKIVLAGLMVALALTNRFGVLPGLEHGEAEAAETIPLTVVAELSCAVLIVLIVGFLGQMPPMQM